jgi:hypothetical protein
MQYGMLYDEQIGNGGIIYTPGSAGTRQEVFQAACRNHYAPTGSEVLLTTHTLRWYWRFARVYSVGRAVGCCSVQVTLHI